MRNMISALTLSPAIDKTVYIDGFRVDEVNKAQGCCQVPGSKGVNVARILAACGVESVCFGFIGGEGGRYVADALRADGVKSEFVDVDYDIRTNIKLVDLQSGTYTDINFPGGTPSAQNLDALRAKTRVLARESALIALGGSVPPGVEERIYYELAQIANEEGARVSLDCYNAPLRHAIQAKPLVIKPNLEELEMTFGQKFATLEAIIEKAQALCRDGIENVLVSLGADGAVAVCGGDVFRLYTDDLPVYNTVGAGDAFLSGFLYGWKNGMDTVACLRHCISFSQAVVSSRADEDKTLAQLTKYVPTARVEPIYTQGGGRG